MAFSMFSPQASPIAIDFGAASLKLLQLSAGDRPKILAAAEMAVPDALRLDPEKLTAFYTEELPKTLAAGRFKSRRAVMSIPSAHTLVQHMQITDRPGTSRDELIKGQLYSQVGCPPDGVVVRSIEVGNVQRGGQSTTEVICFAIARDTVMRYVNLLAKCKLNVAGVHTEALAVVRAFDHINRRSSDREVTTLYVDMGWGGTQIAVAHGRQIVFARHTQIGGRHFDQHIAARLHCSVTDARAHRMSMAGDLPRTPPPGPAPDDGANRSALLQTATAAAAADRASADGGSRKPGTEAAVQSDRRAGLSPAATCYAYPTGDPASEPANLDLGELVETVTDELSMCLRYHQGLFPDRTIDRTIFVGGEARQVWFCQHVVRALQLPAQLGDPISRLRREDSLTTPGVDLNVPQPGWAVALGLCRAPTDL